MDRIVSNFSREMTDYLLTTSGRPRTSLLAVVLGASCRRCFISSMWYL